MIETALTDGWAGVVTAYTAVQAPMIVGLIRARARLHHFVLSPLVAVPLTGIAAIGVVASNFLLAHLGFGYSQWVQLTVGTGLGAALGYASGTGSTQDVSQGKSHDRGSLVVESPAPGGARPRRNAGDAGLTLAGVAVPTRDETKHFKVIGTTGTGKSTAIREMLAGALARGDRAVIADPDAGYLDRFYRPDRGDVLLNPFDKRSLKWDLFSEIESAYDVEQLARSLIPDQGEHDRSWREYARTFFTAVTRQAHQAGIKSVDELYRLLVAGDLDQLRVLVRGTAAQPFLDEHNSRMFDSIRSVTSSAVGALEYVGRQEGQEFSIRKWVRDQAPGVLFMPYKAGQIAALHSTISAWMRLAIFEAMDQEEQREEKPHGENRRLWFVVDELDALGQIDGLKDALARLRKFDGRCVLGFQSIAQVSNTYGPGNAHTIVENCGNTLILRCSASEGGGTARFASQLIGEREVLHTTESTSRRHTEIWGSVTHSQHRSLEAAVLPSEIEQLPDLAGYLKYASDPVWQKVRLDAKRAWQEHRRPVQPQTEAARAIQGRNL